MDALQRLIEDARKDRKYILELEKVIRRLVEENGVFNKQPDTSKNLVIV